MKWWSAFLVLVLAVPAAAQDTIGLYFDEPVSGLQRYGYTIPGQPFEIVALIRSDSPGASMEFVMTELAVAFPGVFKLSTTKINNTPIDGGDNSLGEYVLDYSACVEPGVLEVVRVQYGDFSGVLANDIVLWCRGLQPGEPRRRTRHRDLTQHTVGQTLAELDPGVAAVDGLPEPTTGGAEVVFVGAPGTARRAQ